MAFAAVTVTTSASKIVSANNRRVGLIITNNEVTPLFIGPDNTVTTANGTLVGGKASFGDTGKFTWRGDVFGIVNGGSSDVRYWEFEE